MVVRVTKLSKNNLFLAKIKTGVGGDKEPCADSCFILTLTERPLFYVTLLPSGGHCA